MKKSFKYFVLIVLLWPNILLADNSEQAIGFYSNGSLKNANQLPDEGIGFVKILRSRDRSWATNNLINLIEQIGESFLKLDLTSERLQIGDISSKDGGKISRHKSHQNGLDVDVSYLRVNRIEQDPEETEGFNEVFVTGNKLTENFDVKKNWLLFKLLAENENVDRIFVDPVIKKSLCNYISEKEVMENDYNNSENTAVLRKIRNLQYNHKDHFHLRLACPKNSRRCKPQPVPPEGDGC